MESNLDLTEVNHPLNLTPFEEEFLTRQGTEIQSSLKLFQANTDSVDSTIFTISNMTHEVRELFNMAKEKGLVSLGSGTWNVYQLVQLAKEMQKHHYLENYQIVQLHGNPLIQQEILQDIRQQLVNSSLKAAICFLRLIKMTTILLEPQSKALSQSVLDGSTHVISLALQIPKKAEHRRNPDAIKWKDTAHKVFKITVSTLSLVGSIYAATLSVGYTDKEDYWYKTANQLAMAGMVADIGYGLLQQVGLLQKRN